MPGIGGSAIRRGTGATIDGMRRSALGVVFAVTLVLAVTPTRPAAADVVAEYRARVLAALDGSTATGVGVVVTVEGHGRVVEVNPSLGLPPASTQKLYTVGAALHRLGPGTRLNTEVRRVGTLQPDGTLHGDLVLVGGGDPTVDRKALYALGNAVGAAGVRRVTGSLWVDDSRYDRVRSGPGWKPQWVPQQSGPLSALSVDRNRWRADAGFLADPVPATTSAGQEEVAVMRTVVRVAAAVLGLLFGVSWTATAAHACALPGDPAPVEVERQADVDAGSAMLFGLTALAAARWSGARRVPSSPG